MPEKKCVFIDYYEERSAVTAQHQLQGMVLDGNIIEIGFGKYEERNNTVFLCKNECDDIERQLNLSE